MRNDTYDFDEIDSILAQFNEFSSDTVNAADSLLPENRIQTETAETEEYVTDVTEYADADERQEPQTEYEDYEWYSDEPDNPSEDETDAVTEDETAVFVPSRSFAGRRNLSVPEDDEEEEPVEEYEEYEDEYEEYEDDFDDEEVPVRKKDSFGKKILFAFSGMIFAAIGLIILAWVGVKVHPDAETSSVIRGDSRANIFTQLDTYSNNSKGEVLGDLAFIRKVYSIPEGSLTAPAPNLASYGMISYDEPQKVLELIERAKESGLIGENEKTAFDVNADFFPDDRNIQYYYDDTILMIAWKELIENRICSFVEVKLGDASQFRRKLANDSFQTAVQINCSDLAASANAVAAMNADFFAFRDYGICVYQRQVYRVNPRMVDTCYITASGDMIYSRAGELWSQEEAQAFVNANDVLFSLAFGPVLINDGVVQYCPTYPMGEPDLEYSRAGIGQIDKLHYLYMTVNHTWPDREAHPRCNVNEFANLFATKPVYTAYNLDGGQTSEISILGQMFNRVDWGKERPVSDIIYFATALPESEVTG